MRTLQQRCGRYNNNNNKKQIEIVELENTTEINLLNGLNSR